MSIKLLFVKQQLIKHLSLRVCFAITCSIVAIGFINACSSNYKNELTRNAKPASQDFFGDKTDSIVYLDQGWDESESEWFYNTTQGSDLMSYWLFVNLEDSKSTGEKPELFRKDENILRYRYLPQAPSPQNPDGLPLGFVKDEYKDVEYVGFTCAACHTTQVNVQGVGVRIDGGPAMADMVMFLTELEEALKSTLEDPAKLERLATRAEKSVDAVKSQTEKDHATIQNYNTLNHSEKDGKDIHYGYARLDAFGRIFNRILAHLTPETETSINSPNAPVSIPFLWDTPYHDFVQWNGIGDNGSETVGLRLGPLGRNVGEVLGVFANFTLEPGDNQFVSSANKLNLEKLEQSLQSLYSPSWADAAAVTDLKPIDHALAKKGKAVYDAYECGACHQHLGTEERKSIDRRVIAQFTSTDYLGTDTTMLTNAASYCGKPGYLIDADVGMCPSNPKDVPAAGALSSTARKVIVKGDPEESLFKRAISLIKLVFTSTKQNPIKETQRHVDLEVSNKSNLMAYKGRPLNGIWATAPYLHNGSVPNLYELFLPACHNVVDAQPAPGENCRSITFTVGNRELDAEKVGFTARSATEYPGLFVFDTTLPGNLNIGHEYAAGVTPMIKTKDGKVLKDAAGRTQTYTFDPITQAQRMALIEYLKTL